MLPLLMRPVGTSGSFATRPASEQLSQRWNEGLRSPDRNTSRRHCSDSASASKTPMISGPISTRQFHLPRTDTKKPLTGWTTCRRALVSVSQNSFDPPQFTFQLLDGQLDHPNGFMIRMSDFSHDVLKRRPLLG